MTEQPLRPIGTEFETVTVESPDERVITRWRVVGHDEIHGQVLEHIEVVAIYYQKKAPPTPSERK